MSGTIHVVNAADAAYVPHTSAMLHSLFTRNPGQTFVIHFLHRTGLDQALVERLTALCGAHGASLRPTPVRPESLSGVPTVGRFTEEAWYRIVLPELLPDVTRALWLDSDVLVLAPIRELWETELGGYPLAACPNAVMFNFREVVANIGVSDRRCYFNSGVMLMNLQQMRDEKSADVLRHTAQRSAQWLRFADQDVLNIAYHLRYRRLRLAWNVLSQTYINLPETIRVHGQDEFDEAMTSPRIIHFTGAYRFKPWFYACSHPHRDTYLKHRVAAGWPPPDYPDRTLRNSVVRHVPLRLREIVGTMRRRQFGETLSFLREW